MKTIIGFIAAALVFIAYAPYFRDILRGKSRPHPYSWFVWGLTTSIIFALQLSHGGGAGSWTTATVAGVSFVICALGLRQGAHDIRPLDTAFLLAALIAMGIWLVARQPLASMILLNAVDLLGFGPTIRKAWHKPFEETLSLWTISWIRHALSIFALQSYNLITVLNPALWVAVNLGFGAILIIRRRALPSSP